MLLAAPQQTINPNNLEAFSMGNYEVVIDAASPRHVGEEEAELLLDEILSPELIKAIANIGCDETVMAGFVEQR
jgi:hypothetical protein